MSPRCLSILSATSVGSDKPVDVYRFIIVLLQNSNTRTLEIVLLSSFIYRKEIFDAITKTLLDEEKIQKNGLNYLQLYKKCLQELKPKKISHSDFSYNLNEMVRENLLDRDEHKDSRLKLKPVSYSITENAKEKYRLKILGNDERTQKNRSLYQLLICSDGFKKHEMLTEKQVDGFLRKIHCSRNDLKEHRVSKAGIFFKHIKGVQIVKWIENDSKIDIRAGFYSVSIPGFNVKEFILSLRKLKKGKGLHPRPFSSYPAVTDVPFVLHIDYTEEEVKDAIDLLRKARVIKVINDVFPGEMRYDISDESLKDFVKDVWLLHNYDFRLLIERLVYNGKPVSEDKDYLTSFLGNKYASKILADVHHIQDSYKKENESEERKEIARKFTEDFDKRRSLLVQDIGERHKKVIKEYRIVSEIIQEICLPRFISQNSS